MSYMVIQYQRMALLALMSTVLLAAPVAFAQKTGNEGADSSQFVFIESTPPPALFLSFAASLHDYYNALANNSDQIPIALNAVGKFYPADTEIDINALDSCLKNVINTASVAFSDTAGAYENSFVITNVYAMADGISLVEYSHSHTALRTGDQYSELNTIYVSENAVLGNHPETTAASAQCWNSHAQLTKGSKSAFQLSDDNNSQSDSSSQLDEPIAIKQSGEPIISTGNNKWDLITHSDPNLFECLVYRGRVQEDIFDKRINSLVVHNNVYQYVAYYKDGTSLVIRAHPEYETEKLASGHALNIASKVGQLPTLLRANIQRIAIMRGDKTAMGDGGGEGIHLQTGNTTLREQHNRLEETLFHEAVHTSVDEIYANQQGWLDAQRMDQKFLTEYGRRLPEREDLAETLLYVYALIYHPTRIPENYRDTIAQRIPNRIAYIKKAIFNTDTPLGTAIERDNECNKS